MHFTRNAQALVPRSAAGMVASAIRSIFEQPDEHAASEQLRRVADGLAAVREHQWCTEIATKSAEAIEVSRA